MIRKILLSALAALLLAACAAKPSFEPAMLVHSVQPVYPPPLEEEGIAGRAIVRMRIDTRGSVSEAQVLSATHPLFARSAVRAPRTFYPTKIRLFALKLHTVAQLRSPSLRREKQGAVVK